MTLNQQTRLKQLIKALRKWSKSNLEVGAYSLGKEQHAIANLLAEIMESD